MGISRPGLSPAGMSHSARLSESHDGQPVPRPRLMRLNPGVSLSPGCARPRAWHSRELLPMVSSSRIGCPLPGVTHPPHAAWLPFESGVPTICSGPSSQIVCCPCRASGHPPGPVGQSRAAQSLNQSRRGILCAACSPRPTAPHRDTAPRWSLRPGVRGIMHAAGQISSYAYPATVQECPYLFVVHALFVSGTERQAYGSPSLITESRVSLGPAFLPASLKKGSGGP